MGIHPSTFYLVGEFLAVGTQVRVEKPMKSAVVCPVSSIEAPIVRLVDGSVVRVDKVSKAKEIAEKVDKVLFLGDILIAVGEFIENNHPLLRPGFCEEWWAALLEKALEKTDANNGIVTLAEKMIKNPFTEIKLDEAIRISKTFNVPLHPMFLAFWERISGEDLGEIVENIIYAENGKVFVRNKLKIKALLERVCLPHSIVGDQIVIEGKDAELLYLLKQIGVKNKGNALESIGKTLGVRVKPKSGAFIGLRVGRPEKADARMKKKRINVLFPVGQLPLSSRSIRKAAKRGYVMVEIQLRKCPRCGFKTPYLKCDKCGSTTIPVKWCPLCSKEIKGRICNIHGKEAVMYRTFKVNIKKELEDACKKLGEPVGDIRGVKGLMSSNKVPERIEKGVLRAKHSVYIYKDGTIRFDATDLPLTRFKPKEINVSVEKLRKLGYTVDCNGNPLESEDQEVELKIQDIIVSRKALEYLKRIADFVDDELEKIYGLERYYNLSKPEDLIGKMVLTIAPHTLVAVTARIIGYTDVNGVFAHPFLIQARRRNCDGDEDSIILVMDALLNFSKAFLPKSVGGREDVPLLIVTRVDPEFIDDEVYNMEVVDKYPAEFYEFCEAGVPASKAAKIIETVGDRIGKGDKYPRIGQTHSVDAINEAPLESRYKKICLLYTSPSPRDRG